MATPYALVSHQKTTSTQDEARRLIGRHPMLVVARSQSAGRGRSGSNWENAPDALAASLAVRIDWPSHTWPRLTLVAGVAAVRTLNADIALKWPNDLVRGDDKLGGILTDVSDDVVVIGWGANLHWPEAPDGIGAVLGAPPRRGLATDLAQTWAEQILGTIRLGPDRWPVDEYRSLCRTIGGEITWKPDGRGVAVGVDDSGGLVVKTAAGETTLTAGAVREVRPVER